MPHHALLDTLAAAEIEFARFNALRTGSSAGTEVSLACSEHFHVLADPSRPKSAYYNRAIARHVGRLPAVALAELPRSVAAVELRPSETDAHLVDRLLDAGFRPSAAPCYLAARAPLGRLALAHPVTRLHETQTDFFFDLLESAGTPFPQERRDAKRQHYCTDEFQVFVVADAPGRALGWSTMFRSGSVAFLGNAYTQPGARGRGIHAALLAARLNAALDAGVEHVFTDVEHGSQSHANCERIGLRTVTVNTVWERRA